MSGLPLGRKSQTVSADNKKQAAADEAIRNHVEGKFGQTKRRLSLGRIMTKLASTSAAQISLSFLVMNLERALRQLFYRFFALSCLVQGPFRQAQRRLTEISASEVALSTRGRVGRGVGN